MKNHLLSLFLFLLPATSLTAQASWEDVLTEPYSRITFLARQDTLFAAAGERGVCSDPQLYRYDLDGAQLWSASPYPGPGGVTSLFIDSEDRIVGAGQRLPEDLIDLTEGIHAFRYDAGGNAEFTTQVQLEDFFTPYPAAIVELPNGEYLLGHNRRLIWLTAEGDSIQQRDIPYGPLQTLAVTSDTTLIVQTKNELYRINLQGDSLGLILAQEPIVDVHFARDTLWLVDAFQAWRYTEAGGLTAGESIEALINVDGIFKDLGELYVWGAGDTFLAEVYKKTGDQ